VPRGTLEELASLAFVERGEDAIFVGKTHLSVAIGYEAVMAHKQVYFTEHAKVVNGLKSTDDKGTLERRWRFYEHCSLLILDELG
jgi:DNA replication protein DnaC